MNAVGDIGRGTRLVHVADLHVADRGADDLSMMSSCLHYGVGFLIRAQHNRCMNNGTDKPWLLSTVSPGR